MALSALTRRVNKMVVKAVWKFTYKQVLVAFGSRSSVLSTQRVYLVLFTFFIDTTDFSNIN